MSVTIEFITYGVLRLVAFLVLLISALYFIKIYLQRKRVVSLYMAISISLLAITSLHVVVYFFLGIWGIEGDITALIYFIAMSMPLAALLWPHLLSKLDRRFKYLFYVLIPLAVLIDIFNIPLVIEINEYGYPSYYNTSISGILATVEGVIFIISLIITARIALKERKSESGLILFLLSISLIITTLVITLWSASVINDTLGMVLIIVCAILLLLSEHPPKPLVSKWIIQ